MANELDKTLQPLMRDLRKLFDDRLPRLVGVVAVQHFKDNFRQQGFVDGGLQAWKPAKRLSSGSKSADANRKTLYSSRNHLYSSTHSIAGKGEVAIVNDVPYAAIHNQGGSSVGKQFAISVSRSAQHRLSRRGSSQF